MPRASKHNKKRLISTIIVAEKLIVLALIGKKIPLSIDHWILALLKLAKLAYRSLRCLIKSGTMDWFGLLTQSNTLHNLDPVRRHRVLSNSIDFWAMIKWRPTLFYFSLSSLILSTAGCNFSFLFSFCHCFILISFSPQMIWINCLYENTVKTTLWFFT